MHEIRTVVLVYYGNEISTKKKKTKQNKRGYLWETTGSSRL